jgi:hypothetical protein
MATIINADTSTGGAIITGDGSGQLALQAAGVTKLTVASGGVTLATPLAVASGGTGGSATPTAGGIVYGTGTVQAVSAAGTSGQVLQSNGASAPTWATVSSGLTLGTPVASTSGTSIDFTGIPAGTKQIIISFKGVSTTGTSNPGIQLGDSGGVENSGYLGESARLMNATSLAVISISSAFTINSTSAANTLYGSLTLTLENATTFSWSATWNFSVTSGNNGVYIGSGAKSLTAVLDRVRITSDGIQTFDAGEINIAYI